MDDLTALAEAIRKGNEAKRKPGPATKDGEPVCPGCRRVLPKAKPDKKKKHR